MINESCITATEWRLLFQLLERERADLPPEIHQSRRTRIFKAAFAHSRGTPSKAGAIE